MNVTVEEDGETVTVSDNGRGIPVTVHSEYQDEGITQLELALTKLHAGGKFTHDTATGGLHGVGVSCVNAVSDYMKATIHRDGGIYEQSFSQGIPTSKTLKVGDSKLHGTSITFHPDKEIFTDTIKYDEEIIVSKLRESAMLNGGLNIKFHNKSTGRKENFIYQSGIADYVKFLSSNKTGLYPSEPISASGTYKHASTGKTIEVQFAMQYGEDDNETVKTFANNIHNPDGGTHLSGFKTCLTRIINQYARSSGALKEKSSNLSGDDIREGIICVISVRVPQPQFESQTKVKLVSPEAETAVNSVLSESLTDFFDKNPSVISQIVKRAMTAQEAREAAKISQEEFNKYLPDELTQDEQDLIYDYVQSVIKEDIQQLELPASTENIFLPYVKSLTKYMIDNGLEIQPLPKVKFIDDDAANADDFFGKTAYYVFSDIEGLSKDLYRDFVKKAYVAFVRD